MCDDAAMLLRDKTVVVLGARDRDALAQLAGELDPGGERVAHRPADMFHAFVNAGNFMA